MIAPTTVSAINSDVDQVSPINNITTPSQYVFSFFSKERSEAVKTEKIRLMDQPDGTANDENDPASGCGQRL
jgi:hypothetical protein